jgi:acylphosphatase
MLHYKVVVSGRVQGVYFRAFTQKSAKKHHIIGAVRNLEDGRVEVIATGDENNMQLFLQECHKGPIFSGSFEK